MASVLNVNIHVAVPQLIRHVYEVQSSIITKHLWGVCAWDLNCNLRAYWQYFTVHVHVQLYLHVHADVLHSQKLECLQREG